MGWYGEAERRFFNEGYSRVWTVPPNVLAAFGGAPTRSSVTVTPEKATGLPAVSSAVRLLSETPASLPLPVYRRLRPRGKERAEDHHLYSVLHDQANEEMTAFTFREIAQQHAVMWGNIFAEKERDGRGRVVGLWPLNPARTHAFRKDGEKFIRTRIPNGSSVDVVVLPADAVFHIPFFSTDGLNGRSLIGLHRETVGIGLAQDEFTARFLGQGAASKGALTTDKKITEEGWKRLAPQQETFLAGLSNSHRVAILDHGLKWEQVGIPPKDAEMLDSRKWSVEEIARIFRVPPHAIQHLSPAPARANVEVQSLELVIYTLMPWLVRWEQAIRMQLIPQGERSQFFAEFVVAGLLRGDTEARYEAYQIGRQNGFLSANDVRTLENLPLIDNPGADDYHVQLNMATLSAVSAMSESDLRAGFRSMFGRMLQPAAIDAPSVPLQVSAAVTDLREERTQRSVTARHRLQQAHLRLFQEAANRLVRRETTRGRKALRDVLEVSGVEAFREWLREFYDEITPFAEGVLRGPLDSYADLVLAEVVDELASDDEIDAEAFIAAYVAKFAGRHLQSSRLQLERLIDDRTTDDARDAVSERYDDWDQSRPAKVAALETVRAGGALAVFGYRALGVGELRWHAVGESCPYCESLNGTVVGIDDVFIAAGGEIDPGVEGVEPLRVNFDVGHPPAHSPGCDCLVGAA